MNELPITPTADFFVMTGEDSFRQVGVAAWVEWCGLSGRAIAEDPKTELQLRRLVAESHIRGHAVLLTEFFGASDTPEPKPWRSTLHFRVGDQWKAQPMTARYATRAEAQAGHDRSLAALLGLPEILIPEEYAA